MIRGPYNIKQIVPVWMIERFTYKRNPRYSPFCLKKSAFVGVQRNVKFTGLTSIGPLKYWPEPLFSLSNQTSSNFSNGNISPS